MEREAESRRARQRRELVSEIVDAAQRQLAAGGPSGVSLRGIAREVGLSPASLYTYFASVDEIFTEMIICGFGDLSNALATAAEAADSASHSPLDRLHGVAQKYRQWALENTARFNLLFTDQIPGYVAPPDGPTIAAEISVVQHLYGAISPVLGYAVRYRDLPESAQHDIVGVFALIHGAVNLEANHHLQPALDWNTLFHAQIDVAVAARPSMP
jgi:AcrR family transcriptional regulator